MFWSAAAAPCIPAHEDWLNDLSLMPPVSVTMQPVKWAVLVAVPEDDELGFAHPAATKATALSVAATWKASYRLATSLPGACCRPLRERFRSSYHLPPPPPRATGVEDPQTPCFGMIAG